MKKILVSVLILAGLVMTGCENFLADTELKDKVNETINIAKSGTVKLKIEADRDYYGLFLDKMEGDFTFKTAQTVTVRFQLDPSCSFKRWMIADSVTGKEIEDAVKVIDEITETENGSEVHTIKFTFLKSLPNLQLKPVCFLKNDTTAPEFTAFEVYNLGTYDEENEENNVLVTDKVFEEWLFNTDSTAENPDDFDTHHVNGLKLKFMVKEDGQYEDGYLKVTEKLIRDVNGNNVDIVNTCLMPMSQVGKENCRNLGGGNYEVETDYEFVTSFDGVIAVTFAPVDAAGNDAKQGRLSYYVIKDTKINSFEYTMAMNPDTWEYEETLAESGDLWYNRYSFYYYPDKLLLNSSDAYSIESAIENMTVSGEMSNFLLDTDSGGYATPEGFRALLNKYFLSSGAPVYDVWYKGEDSEHIKKDLLTPSIEISDDGVNFKSADILKDKIKIFDNYCDGENCAYTEVDAYYIDVSGYKKDRDLYFRFTVKDSAENPSTFIRTNADQHSAEILRADKVLTNNGLKNNDETEFNTSVPKIYDIGSKLDLKVTDASTCNIASAGFFYCLTYTDGSVSNIKYSPDDPSLTAFSYSGDIDGNYISPSDARVIQYNQQQYTTAKGPEDYPFNSILIWNLSCNASVYNDDMGSWCKLDYSDISSEKHFDYSDIKVLPLFEDEIEVYTINAGNGLCTLGFLYPEYGRIHGDMYNPADWKIYIKYEGVVYTEGGFSENGNQMYISNIPASKLREGVTFDAYADCRINHGLQRVVFTNKSYRDPDAGYDVEPPEFEVNESGNRYAKISDYYPHMHYPANTEIFTFSDAAFNIGDIIDVDVYYVKSSFAEGLSYSEIRKLEHLTIHSQPVKAGAQPDRGYADVIFDYSFLDDRTYIVYFVVNDKAENGNRISDISSALELSAPVKLNTSDGNILCLRWKLDNRLLLKPFTLEEEYYVEHACELEGLHTRLYGEADDNIVSSDVYDSADTLTDFQCSYGYNEVYPEGVPNIRYSNFIYGIPVGSYYYYDSKEGDMHYCTKEEFYSRPYSGEYHMDITGLTECNVKNVITNEEEGVYQVFCDQSVLVEYLINDKLVSQDDGDYWEHHTSNDNKTFTQLTVANPGQTTVKGYKIPEVPAGKYGFIIFHFADGTSMNSGVIEG